MAIRADLSSRTVGIIRDWVSQDGLQTTLRLPERALGERAELLCGVAAAWHLRAGEEPERGVVLRCSEKGSAPWVAARELTGAGAGLQSPARPGSINI